MIIDGVSPTDDVSAVSVMQVVNRLKLKSKYTLHVFLQRTLKYIAYHEPRDEDEDVEGFKNNKFGVVGGSTRCEKTLRLMMPLDTALRLIKDAEAGLILAKAERLS